MYLYYIYCNNIPPRALCILRRTIKFSQPAVILRNIPQEERVDMD